MPETAVVQILEPTAPYLIDRQPLRAKVSAPEGLEIDWVEFRLDGRVLRRFERPPFAMEHDFGPELLSRRLEVVAKLRDGSMHRASFESEGADLSFSQDVRAVALTVAVQSSEGEYVMDLAEQQFQVRENGKLQTITSFSTETGPLKLAMLLDTSGSMEKRLPALKRGASRFLDQKRLEDQVVLVQFSHIPALVHELSEDTKRLKRAVARLRASGGTRLYDALFAALMSLKSLDGNRAVVVFTDGTDESDRFEGAGVESTEEEVIEVARHMQVPIYTIGLGDEVDLEALDRLSDRTGGRALFPARTEEIEPAYQQIQTDLLRRYSIVYQSNNRVDAGEWLEIEVRLPDPSLKAHHRKGYFSEVEDGPLR